MHMFLYGLTEAADHQISCDGNWESLSPPVAMLIILFFVYGLRNDMQLRPGVFTIR